MTRRDQTRKAGLWISWVSTDSARVKFLRDALCSTYTPPLSLEPSLFLFSDRGHWRTNPCDIFYHRRIFRIVLPHQPDVGRRGDELRGGGRGKQRGKTEELRTMYLKIT